MSFVKTLLFHAAATLLLLIVVVAPIPLGSNRDWASSPLALLVGIALALLGLALLLRGAVGIPASASLTTAAVAMILVLAWTLLQATSWALPSPLSPILSSAAAALGQALPGRGTIDTERTVTAAMRLAAYGGVFWLSAHVARERRYASAIGLAVIASGLIVTFYGWAMSMTSHSCIVLFIEKEPQDNTPWCSFAATFVNPNNYADFAALCALVCIARIQELLLQAEAPNQSARARWRLRLMVIGGRGALHIAALVVIVGGVILSASRSGLASFAIAAVTMMMLTTFLRHGGRRNIVGTLVAVSLFIVVPMLAGGGHVVRRFLGLIDQGDPDRIFLLDATLGLVSGSPWSGWGLGSFEPMFSIFQPIDLTLHFDKAHNVYLETASDIGIPAALILLAAMAVPLGRCVVGLRERRRDTQFAAAAIGAAVLMALHSLVDFGLQIPAVAVSFAAILGAGWSQSWSSRLPG
jgi:O-antigen ligase